MTDMDDCPTRSELSNFLVLANVRAGHSMPGIQQEMCESAHAATANANEINGRSRSSAQKSIHLARVQTAHHFRFQISNASPAQVRPVLRSAAHDGGLSSCRAVAAWDFFLELLLQSRAPRWDDASPPMPHPSDVVPHHWSLIQQSCW